MVITTLGHLQIANQVKIISAIEEARNVKVEPVNLGLPWCLLLYGKYITFLTSIFSLNPFYLNCYKECPYVDVHVVWKQITKISIDFYSLRDENFSWFLFTQRLLFTTTSLLLCCNLRYFQLTCCWHFNMIFLYKADIKIFLLWSLKDFLSLE